MLMTRCAQPFREAVNPVDFGLAPQLRNSLGSPRVGLAAVAGFLSQFLAAALQHALPQPKGTYDSGWGRANPHARKVDIFSPGS